MQLDQNALTVLSRRYLTKDEHGNLVETPEELFGRVAKAIAAADACFGGTDTAAVEQAFYESMTNLEFLPNSPTLMNAGKPLGQLSACFVLPVGDSMPEIFDTVKNAALIHKSGGGTGFSFSRVRPAGSAVRSTGGVASGPISFMKVFNAATEAVKQGGTRRGANMGILRVDHPDILDFIRCKQDDSQITNFNISIGITEAFMLAVENDALYALRNPHNGQEVVQQLRAREVFELIVDMAWRNGEPGIIFLDRLNRDNIVPTQGEIESTNPCGEQPLLPYESCNLGSINLARMLRQEEGGYSVDYEALGRVVDTAMHFLDNVIEVNKYPLDEIERQTKLTRKVGLGVMGFADLLFKLHIPYDSEEGIALAEELMAFINTRAHAASKRLAEQRGAFPLFAQSTYANGDPIRNGTCTTIAPTGTISILCNASSGVEPLFALAFVRNVMDQDELPQVNVYFEEIARREGFYSEELMRRIAQEGTLAHIEGIPAHIKRVFVTAHDISPEYHIRMQAAFQKHTDNAVSKTVNFAHDATREDVAQVYRLAYQLDCKGVTIYRDGSRSEQVLTVGAQTLPSSTEPTAPVSTAPVPTAPARIVPRARPSVTQGITEKIVIGCGNLYVTVNYDEQGICEVFANLGRAGGCPSQSEAASRLVSTSLRAGVDVETIIEQLKGIRCHATLRQRATNQNIKVLSCPDAIGKVLEKVAKLRSEGEAMGISPAHNGRSLDSIPACNPEDAACTAAPPTQLQGTPCPDCGSGMEHEGGCAVCRRCGYSKCG